MQLDQARQIPTCVECGRISPSAPAQYSDLCCDRDTGVGQLPFVKLVLLMVSSLQQHARNELSNVLARAGANLGATRHSFPFRDRVTAMMMWRDLRCNRKRTSLRLHCVAALAQAGATLGVSNGGAALVRIFMPVSPHSTCDWCNETHLLSGVKLSLPWLQVGATLDVMPVGSSRSLTASSWSDSDNVTQPTRLHSVPAPLREFIARSLPSTFARTSDVRRATLRTSFHPCERQGTWDDAWLELDCCIYILVGQPESASFRVN